MSKREIYRKMPLEMMHLSGRTLNALKRGDIYTIGALFDKTIGDLLDLHALGAGSAGELIDKALEIDLGQRVAVLEAYVNELLEERK